MINSREKLNRQRRVLIEDKSQCNIEWARVMEDVSLGIVNQSQIAETMRRCNIADMKIMQFNESVKQEFKTGI